MRRVLAACAALVLAAVLTVPLSSQTAVTGGSTSPVVSYPNSPFSVSAGVVTLNQGQATNEIRLPNGTNPEYGTVRWNNNAFELAAVTNSGTARNLRIQAPAGAAAILLNTSGSDDWQFSSAGDIRAITAGAGAITAGSGTGITVNSTGSLRRTIYKITVAAAAFTCNATTCDITLATLPAKTRIYPPIADLTQAFACASTCTTSTLSITMGKTAGGNEYLVSFDADAAAARFGLADADLGASVNRAGAIAGGDLPSWTATTTLQMRMTSGTGAVGTGAATNFSQGSVTFYVTTEVYP